MMTINGKEYTIADIMRPAIFIEDSATLFEALSKMIQEKRNSLTVVDQDGQLTGMLNSVDIIKEVLPDYIEDSRVAARFSNLELLKEDAERVKDNPLTEFMEKDIPSIKEDGNIIEAAAIAARSGKGRIVVVNDENKPVGVLTRTELKQVIGTTLGICSDCFPDVNSS